MGIFGKNINNYIDEFKADEDAVLIDVREADEYASGRIPGSLNVPLSAFDNIEAAVSDKATKVFVYCLSGARSSTAVRMMKKRGYANVKNIGGIARYKGMIER